MDIENFRTYASHKSSTAREKKQDIDCERNEDIAERIGEMLADKVEAGEQDTEKLLLLAEELAHIAAGEIIANDGEDDNDENSVKDNLVSIVLYNAEHGKIAGLSADGETGKFVVSA